MADLNLPITTERLTLRPYRPEDVEPIHAVLYGDEQARRFTGGVWEMAVTRTIIEGYIERQSIDGYSFWAVLESGSGELIGEAGLTPLGADNEGPEVELGYAFAPHAWGHGHATEAGRAVLDAAFGPLTLERVVAVVDDANAGSRNVLAKLGFGAAGRRRVYGGDLLYLVRARD